MVCTDIAARRFRESLTASGHEHRVGDVGGTRHASAPGSRSWNPHLVSVMVSLSCLAHAICASGAPAQRRRRLRREIAASDHDASERTLCRLAVGAPPARRLRDENGVPLRPMSCAPLNVGARLRKDTATKSPFRFAAVRCPHVFSRRAGSVRPPTCGDALFRGSPPG